MLKLIINISLILVFTVTSYSQKLKPEEVIYEGGKSYVPADKFIPIFIGDQNTIYKKNIDTGEIKSIYIGENNHRSVKLSSDRKYIASIQLHVKELYKPYHRWLNEFIILDIEGNIIHKIDASVMRYAWSPDSKKIAYITGEVIEGKLYKITGHYILDIITGEKKPIKAKGRELNWAKFDNNIYFEGRKYISEKRSIPMMYKYDPIKDKLDETEYKGIYFSPDGNYYIAKVGEGRDNKLFSTRTNSEIRLTGLDLARPKYEWMGKDILLITASDSTVKGWPKHTILYDIDRHSVLVKSAGTPMLKYSIGDDIHKVVMQNKIYSITGKKLETIQKTWND